MKAIGSFIFVALIGAACSGKKDHPDKPDCAQADKPCLRAWFIEEFRRLESPPITKLVEPSPTLCPVGDAGCWRSVYRPLAIRKDVVVRDLSAGCRSEDTACFLALMDAIDSEQRMLARFGVSLSELDERVIPPSPATVPATPEEREKARKAIDELLAPLKATSGQ